MNSTQLNDFFREVRERDNKLREKYYASDKENIRSLYGELADTDD